MRSGSGAGVDVLIFRPVELLASETWVLSCWHPTRTYSEANLVEFVADGAAASRDAIRVAVAKRWQRSSDVQTAGDLGVLVMAELAMSYKETVWKLRAWLEDWELSLYVDDELDNPDELKRLGRDGGNPRLAADSQPARTAAEPGESMASRHPARSSRRGR
jgi:hypothetical protein